MPRRRSGIGRRFGVNENVCVSPVPCRLWKYTAMRTAISSRKSINPGWSRKLNRTTASTTPIATPATNARGNDTMPPITAAASARTSVLGPSVTRLPANPLWAVMRESDNVASAPATAQTNSDTSFGLMPLRRARSRFSADALTLFPNVVRVRNHARNRATIGTMIRIEARRPSRGSTRTGAPNRWPAGSGRRER